MNLAIIKKAVISTVKHSALEGRKLFWVQPVQPDGTETGEAFISIDTVKASVGNQVLVNNEGSGSMEILGLKDAPVQSVIVGIVEKISMSELQPWSKK